MLSEFFLTQAHKSIAVLDYSYSYGLVFLSYAVAAFASYTAFQLLERMIAAPNRFAKFNWLITGAVSMGCGIWSVHFVGMLAVRMDDEAIVMRYDATLTVLSAVFAILASGFAFEFVSRGSRSIRRLVYAGTLLGAGIGAMHYTGMMAMRMAYAIRYDSLLFGVSVIVAVLLSILALRLMFLSVERSRIPKHVRQVSAEIVMGMAVCLMHYTGMAATSFLDIRTETSLIEGLYLHKPGVGLAIGAVTFAILGMAWLGATIDQRLCNKDRELQRREAFLRQIVDTAGDAIVTIDDLGNIRSFNAGGEKIFGYPATEIMGRSISLLIPSFDLENRYSEFSAMLPAVCGPEPVEKSVEGRRKGDEPIILEVSLSEIRLGDQRMFTAILRDISKRHRAEEALRAKQAELRSSQQRLNAIMNTVLDAVISIDEKGTIHSFNAAAERIFGYSVAAAVGNNVTMLMREEDRQHHDGYIQRFLETGEARVVGKVREVVGRRMDGGTFPLELSVNWMELDGNLMFVAVCRDLTRRKQAEAERAELERDLSQAQKIEPLGTLAGGIAHEINTPVQYVGDNVGFLQGAFSDLNTVLRKLDDLLAAIEGKSGVAEVAADTKAAADVADLEFLLDEIPTSIEQSLEGIKRISEIVQAIKEFSHPDAKEKSDIDINHAINTTITVARNQWKYVADLETDFDSSLPQVPCLPGEFNQVILNLVINAAHAIEDASGGSGEKGRITISTRRDGDHVKVRVSDTGVGIPAEICEKIFDPFFTTKETGRGTGQGLAISHSIITKKHGGTISLESEVGKGTTFIIGLPLGGHQRPEDSGVAV